MAAVQVDAPARGGGAPRALPRAARPASRCRAEAVRHAVELLHATGEYEDVRVEAQRGAGGRGAGLPARCRRRCWRSVRARGRPACSPRSDLRAHQPPAPREPLWPARLERAAADVAPGARSRGGYLEAQVAAAARRAAGRRRRPSSACGRAAGARRARARLECARSCPPSCGLLQRACGRGPAALPSRAGARGGRAHAAQDLARARPLARAGEPCEADEPGQAPASTSRSWSTPGPRIDAWSSRGAPLPRRRWRRRARGLAAREAACRPTRWSRPASGSRTPSCAAATAQVARDRRARSRAPAGAARGLRGASRARPRVARLRLRGPPRRPPACDRAAGHARGRSRCEERTLAEDARALQRALEELGHAEARVRGGGARGRRERCPSSSACGRGPSSHGRLGVAWTRRSPSPPASAARSCACAAGPALPRARPGARPRRRPRRLPRRRLPAGGGDARGPLSRGRQRGRRRPARGARPAGATWTTWWWRACARTREEVVRRELLLKEGEPLGLQQRAGEPAPARRAGHLRAGHPRASWTPSRRGAAQRWWSPRRRRRAPRWPTASATPSATCCAAASRSRAATSSAWTAASPPSPASASAAAACSPPTASPTCSAGARSCSSPPSARRRTATSSTSCATAASLQTGARAARRPGA